MSTKHAQRVPATEARAEDAALAWTGPRDTMRRSLAGMTYAQQLEAVRPPMPVRGAVQFQEEGSAPEAG